MNQADWLVASAKALELFEFGQVEAAKRGLILVSKPVGLFMRLLLVVCMCFELASFPEFAFALLLHLVASGGHQVRVWQGQHG